MHLEPPRIETGKPLPLLGLRERYTAQTMERIPAQWHRFGSMIDDLPGRVGGMTYGVWFDVFTADSFEYFTAVEVTGSSAPSPELERVNLAQQTYAVFAHGEHVSKLRDTMSAIQSEWLPRSGYELAQTAGGPDFFERYGPGFDPQAGSGDIEIWLPVKRVG